MSDSTSEKKHPCDESYRVALYRHIHYSWVSVMQVSESLSGYEDYVPLSESLEVRFAPLNNDTVIQGVVAALDAAEKKAFEDCNKRVAEIREQKAQLLALTYQPTAAAAPPSATTRSPTDDEEMLF